MRKEGSCQRTSRTSAHLVMLEMELVIRKRVEMWPRSGNKSWQMNDIFFQVQLSNWNTSISFSLASHYWCQVSFAQTFTIFFQPNVNDILKCRVIVSIAYEVPGTEQKDLQQFAEKLKRWHKWCWAEVISFARSYHDRIHKMKLLSLWQLPELKWPLYRLGAHVILVPVGPEDICTCISQVWFGLPKMLKLQHEWIHFSGLPEVIHQHNFIQTVFLFVALGTLAEKPGLSLPCYCRRRPHDDQVWGRYFIF